MKRVTLTVAAILLAVPATAAAKYGVEFQTDPNELAPGQRTDISMIVMREPRDPSGGPRDRSREPRPVAGVRPLATFLNADTGQTVRVRGSRTSRDGIATATVALPSKGHWSVTLSGPGIPRMRGEGQDFPVGVSPKAKLVETVSPPPAAEPGAASGLPWPLLGIALGALAVLAVVVVRLGPRRLLALLPGSPGERA